MKSCRASLVMILALLLAAFVKSRSSNGHMHTADGSSGDEKWFPNMAASPVLARN